MVIIDKNGNVVEDPDYGKGHVDSESMPVTHKYVIDTEEKGHWETVAEYPETGGADVEWRIDTPESGHWETVDGDGRPVERYDGVIPEDWPHEREISDVWSFGRYVEYTEGELEERERQRREAEYGARQAMQLQTYSLMAARAKVATLEFGSETEIADVSTLLPDWVPDGHEYRQGDAFQWEKRTWRASQNTTSQSIYPPDVSEALYYEIVIAPDGIIVYRAAHGQYDSVRKGELRHYPDADGPVYRSKVDWNAYAPDAVPSNWELVE